MCKCDHIVGIYYDYESTDTITLQELKDYIALQERRHNKYDIWHYYTPSDYSDMSKDVDIQRFNYCPKCGEKIDWKNLF